MEYTITCRLSGDLNIPLLSRIMNPKRGGGERAAHVPPADEVAASALLFAYHFTADDVDLLEEVHDIVTLAFRETAEVFSGRVRLNLETTSVERGSIDISLLVSSVTLWLHDNEQTFHGLAAWAADKFAGGAISEFGKAFTERIKRRVPPREPPASPASSRQVRIRSYDIDAQAKADDVAHRHQCEALPMQGGFAVRAGQSKRTIAFLYGYKLVCGGTGPAGPKYLYVTVYNAPNRPPQFLPSDVLLSIEDDSMPLRHE